MAELDCPLLSKIFAFIRVIRGQTTRMRLDSAATWQTMRMHG
jgi:multisubunit Na+/H+ antiporter MnhF subunit